MDGARSDQPALAAPGAGRAAERQLTVIIPAFNEADSIADTIHSLQSQTVQPRQIIVVDDCSTDGTGDVARACGVTVVRPLSNTGSKAGAQNFALPLVRTPYTMALDADTTLAADAAERLLAAFDGPRVAAACGFVIPRHVNTIWERGRYVEYLFAFSFPKLIQDLYEKPLISSGCFSLYDTDALRANDGWSERTLAEDMDLTWSFYQAGNGVRFVPDAVCYPIEPHNFTLMGKQLRRWTHGFVQNVKVHWRGVLDVPHLRWLIAIAVVDATISSIFYLVLPVIALALDMPQLFLAYVLDAPMVIIPVLFAAAGRKEVGRALLSLPAYFVLRLINSLYFLEAVWTELVVRRTFRVYEKGH